MFIQQWMFIEITGENNIFHDLKVLMKVIKIETFNVDFPSK